MANETKLIITANTNQAEAALRKLGSSVDGVTRNFFDLSGAAASLGSALTVTAFAGIIQGAIDAADNLNDLSQKTGTSIETLAGMKLAADQSGTSLEAFAKAAQTLSTNMADKPELFKSFGVTATDTTGALVQLADIFAAMPDGVDKSALAMALMGDAGVNMIPLLNGGSAALRKLAEEGQRLNPITTEMGAQADAYNDKLAALKMQAGLLGITLANDMLPALNEIADAMLKAAKEGGLLKAAWVGFGGLSAAVFTDTFADPLIKAKSELSSLERHFESVKGGGALARWMYGTADELEKRIAATKKQIKDLQETVVAPTAPAQPKTDGKGKSLLVALRGGDPKTKADPNAGAVASLQADAFRARMQLLGVASAQVKVYELARKGATRAQIDAAQAAADETIAIEAQIKAQKDADKAALEAQKIIFDIDPMAKLQDEWKKLNALKERGLLTDEQVGKAYQKTFDNIKRSGDDTFRSLEDALRGWGNQFTDVMTMMVRTGKADFRSLADSIVNDLIRIQIQKRITDPLVKAGSGILDSVLGGFKFADGGVKPSSDPPVKAGSGILDSVLGSFKFADGGVMTSSGPLPLKTYSRGGIANSPQLAVFGEGRMPEAFVPLPDGRRIPVAMQGAAKTGDTYYIDARGADQAAVARLESLIVSLNGSIERRAVGAVNGALMARGQRGIA